jgi:predicted RNA binding protein YcfA (HicA-like mRNA interferase family)
MPKFLADAPINKVLNAFEQLGFSIVREGNHIAMERKNADGTKTPLTMPNHRNIKGATLRAILTQVNVSRDEFLAAYEQA